MKQILLALTLTLTLMGATMLFASVESDRATAPKVPFGSGLFQGLKETPATPKGGCCCSEACKGKCTSGKMTNCPKMAATAK